MSKLARYIGMTVVAAVVLAAASAVKADIITTPTDAGYTAGDSYRLIFVTSTTTQASSTTASYYNDFVNTLAQSVPGLAALGTTWTCLGNLNGADPQVNTGTTPPGDIATYRLDGSAFATSYTDLWDAPAVPVLYNERGEAMNAEGVGAVAVWTGMGEAMSVPSWNSGGYIGNGGITGNTGRGSSDSAWYTYGFHTDSNDNEFALYAISNVIPEPASGLMLIGAIGAIGLIRRKLRR